MKALVTSHALLHHSFREGAIVVDGHRPTNAHIGGAGKFLHKHAPQVRSEIVQISITQALQYTRVGVGGRGYRVDVAPYRRVTYLIDIHQNRSLGVFMINLQGNLVVAFTNRNL